MLCTVRICTVHTAVVNGELSNGHLIALSVYMDFTVNQGCKAKGSKLTHYFNTKIIDIRNYNPVNFFFKLSRVCMVVHYAVLEAIHAVYGIWQI